MQLIKYQRPTGAIVTIWQSNTRALLEGHVAAGEADAGYLWREEDTVAASELVERWRVQEEALVEKTQVTLIAEPETFVADGEEICLVGVTPPTVCTVHINRTAYALTADDPVVMLTSTTPQTFVVELAAHPTVWALPVMVSAVAALPTA